MEQCQSLDKQHIQNMRYPPAFKSFLDSTFLTKTGEFAVNSHRLLTALLQLIDYGMTFTPEACKEIHKDLENYFQSPIRYDEQREIDAVDFWSIRNYHIRNLNMLVLMRNYFHADGSFTPRPYYPPTVFPETRYLPLSTSTSFAPATGNPLLTIPIHSYGYLWKHVCFFSSSILIFFSF